MMVLDWIYYSENMYFTVLSVGLNNLIETKENQKFCTKKTR